MQVKPPMDEWLNRSLKLQRKLAENDIAGCLVSQNVGIYYFSGSMQAGYLFVPVEGEPAFYVRRSVVRALSESAVRTVELGSFRNFGMQLATDYPALFSSPDRPPFIGADLDVMPAQLYLRLAEAIPQAKWKDASALLRGVRSVKSSYEIERISRAADVVSAALDAGIASLKEGMTELELMTIIETSLRSQGHVGLMRMRGYNQEIVTGVIAAGEAAAEPTYFDGPAGGRGLSPAAPQGVSLRPIGRNEPIIIDIGCCLDGYTIDQTRMAVIGELSPVIQSAYEAAELIMRSSERLLRPGTTPEELYVQALELAEEAGLSEHFMGFGADQVKFLGHGIGLEIDEWPVLARGFREPLEPGMILAIEPKFTFPGVGVVGIENTYLVTETGYRALTVSPEKIYKAQDS